MNLFTQLIWKHITQKPAYEVCVAALFLIAKNRKQPQYPSKGERTTDWQIHTMEYQSAIKGHELSNHEKTEKS